MAGEAATATDATRPARGGHILSPPVITSGQPAVGIAAAATQFVAPGGFACSVDQCSPQEWSEIICGFDDATCDQSWALLADKWGSERLSSIVLRRNGEVAAAALVTLLTVPILKKGIAYLKMGPLWRRKGTGPVADAAPLAAMVDAIKQEYCVRRGLLVTVLLPPDPDFGQVAEGVLRDRGLKVRRQMPDPNRYLVNVTLSEQEQLESLQQKWRYNLRKSLKNDFSISAHDDDTALAQFMTLYEEMARRKGLQEASPRDGLASLIRELPAAARPWTVLVEHEGAPTAGAVVGKIGSTASYLFGATDERALPLKAGYALQWWIVDWLRRSGDVRWYDLGGEAMDQGLRQFKKGLTGKAGEVVAMAGEFEVWRDPLSWLVAEGGAGLRSMMRGARRRDADLLRGRLRK